jgi:AcrR family transcriptional regulator
MKPNTRQKNYHHGDLRATLLREAGHMLREAGLEGVTLRKLADRAGVSRTALYHHFRDKNDLLCAIAADGFLQLSNIMDRAQLQPDDSLTTTMRDFVRAYIRFATGHPEQYDLMFGRHLWKVGRPTQELQTVAYRVFRDYARDIGRLEPVIDLRGHRSMLRLAQASWATLHGLCRLLIDGIYVNVGDLEEISDEAVAMMMAGMRSDGAT